MKVLRTPEERFEYLPGYDFAPHYLDVPDFERATLRVHYLEEGPPDGEVVLLLHGEPSWSYLYRKMIPPLSAAGFRVVAPDLVGFGKSDKPTERTDYTYERHIGWMVSVIEQLDLRGITLFGQDWGGLLGLRIAAEHPDRFDRIVASNTALPTGDFPLGEAFDKWREFSQRVDVLPIGFIISGACARPVAPEVIAAYEAPFPDETYKAGARQFPAIVPATPDDPAAPANRAAWDVLSKWTKPVLTCFGDSDPVTAGGDRILQSMIPGASGQPHQTIANAGHFIQEDCGEQLADLMIDFITTT